MPLLVLIASPTSFPLCFQAADASTFAAICQRPGAAATPKSMADVFLSYARPDEGRAAIVAEGIEAGGRSLWWDRLLSAGDDYALTIENEIDAARCVVVAWSKAAHDSL